MPIFFCVCGIPLIECPPLSSSDIRGYCMGQYHVSTKIKKYGYFFFGENRNFWVNSNHVYLDCVMLYIYKFLCKPQYELLRMSVTFHLFQIAHNPSTKYCSNGQTSAFGGLRSPLNH